MALLLVAIIFLIILPLASVITSCFDYRLMNTEETQGEHNSDNK